MLPLLYTHPTYTLIFVLAVGAWASSELLGPVRRNRSREGSKQDRGSMPVSVIIGLSGLALCFLLPVLVPGATIPWQPGTFFAGLAVMLLGVSWRWYAIATLGKYFTGAIVIQEQHVVVQHGPYKFIRHPSYSGAFLIAIGIGLMVGNWLSIVTIIAGFVVGMMYRIPVEEQVLLQALGQPYETYMKRTKRLIPFIF